MKKNIRYFASTAVGLLGLITLFLSTSVILNLFDIREKQGNYVMFIIWANLIVGLLYLASSYGFFTNKKVTTQILVSSFIILIVAFVGLNIHIYMDGLYELKTYFAMIFRICLTLFFIYVSYFFISKNRQL